MVTSHNVFLGGVSSNLDTATKMAAKLTKIGGAPFTVSDVQNFEIVGSNIKCLIEVDHELILSAFNAGVNPTDAQLITYYRDTGGYCKHINPNAFRENSPGTPTTLLDVSFPGVTTIDSGVFTRDRDETIISLPVVTSLGGTTGNDVLFANSLNLDITVPVALETIMGGSPDGDLTDAISRGATVTYI